MRSLASKTNVTAPGGDYPYGRLKNNPGDGTGTPVNELVYGDFHQFFEKLMADAGLSANGLPENSANGFQLNAALAAFIDDLVADGILILEAQVDALEVTVDNVIDDLSDLDADLQGQIDVINAGHFDSTMNTDGGGAGVTSATIPIPNNSFVGIEVDMMSIWVSGSAGAGNGGHVKKIYTFKNISGTVSQQGATTTVHSQTTGASVPTISFSISGTDVLIKAVAASGDVYSVRTVVTAK